MKFTIYNNSILATLLSVLGTPVFGIGLLALIGGEFDIAIVFIAAGLGAMVLARVISERKAEKENQKIKAAQAEQEKARQEAMAKAARETEERAAREAQERAAQEAQQKAQQIPQYTERDAQESFEKYWEQVTWKYSMSQISQDVNIMLEIYNHAPELALRKTLAKLRQINFDLIESCGWTCRKCGHRNGIGDDCPCGNKIIVYPF